MKALILSGGKGTRLYPITLTSTKQLLPLANRPVLFHVIETIIAAGIQEIGIVAGDMCAEIQATIEDHQRYGSWLEQRACISYIQQKEPLGLADAIKSARTFIGTERFLVFLGDIFIEENLRFLIEGFEDAHNTEHARLLLKYVAEAQDYGVAQLADEEGLPLLESAIAMNVTARKARIVRLIEKPQEPISNFVLAGVYCFDSLIFTAIDAIQPSTRGELEITDAIQYLLDQQYVIQPYFLRGPWVDTGTMQSLLVANQLVLKQQQPSVDPQASIDATSRLYGEVVVEAYACLKNSIVYGPAIIGPHVTLSDAWIGPFTSIDQGCTIVASKIEQSIILEDCEIHAIGQGITNSLIGRHVKLSASTKKTASYQFLLGDHSHIEV